MGQGTCYKGNVNTYVMKSANHITAVLNKYMK